MADKKAPETKLTPAQAKKLVTTRQLTKAEGYADAADGRRTRVQQKGRRRS